jgi:signal transduction histidine kinase
MKQHEKLEQRLSFLGITSADRQRLAELRPLLESHADRFVAAFYRHLLSFDATRKQLANPEVKERLIQKQRSYLLSLASEKIDEDYVAERARIGAAHERIGLDTGWYLGAYGLYVSLLAPLICENYREDPKRGEKVLTALIKVLLLDAQLAVESYIQRRDREREYLTRELAEMSRTIAREYEQQGATLRATERRAEAAEELASVATLVAGLAHEVGTPMGVIRGHAEILESSVGDERGRWRLRTIRDQIDRISHIIQTLLNIARPQEQERVPVDLQEVLESTLSFLSEKFRRRGIKVEQSLAPAPGIVGGPEKLQQLFLNLFLNAADAMPEGGTLRVSLATGEKGAALVRVADNGHGIPSQELTRIFEPFYTTKPAGRGSGLGLVVARAIVRDHGGAIQVTSEGGQGTEFIVTLPSRGNDSDLTEDPIA